MTDVFESVVNILWLSGIKLKRYLPLCLVVSAPDTVALWEFILISCFRAQNKNKLTTHSCSLLFYRNILNTTERDVVDKRHSRNSIHHRLKIHHHTSPPKNSENISDKARKHSEVTLLGIPNITRTTANLHESSRK